MSLLLEALKKTGEARQHGLPAGTSSPNTPELARSAGQNLFTAKAANTHNRARLGIIPLALISGSLLAAIGGYYVWYETSRTPPMPKTRVAAAPITQRETNSETSGQPAVAAPVAGTNAGSAPVRIVQSAPPSGSGIKEKSRPPQPMSSAASKPAAGVVIEHKQITDTINPALASAYQAYSNGDFATARQLYSSVLSQDAKNRDALLGMAAIAQQQRQDSTAVQYYGQVLALDPRDPAAHAGLSSLTSGDVASTESRLKLLLTHRPDAAPLHFALGNLYAQQSRWGEAQQSYFNATTREPDNSQYAFNLAVSLDHLGQGKLAAQYYQRALQLDKSGHASFDRAQAQQRVNNLTPP